MPLQIDLQHTQSIDLETCIDNLETNGFNPSDKDSVDYAAYQLRSLYNNRSFLNEIIMDELQNRCVNQNHHNAYSNQAIMLHNGKQGFAMRANIWPDKDHYLMRSSGEAAFYFDMPHDHNFDFLTIGYMGPGYWSEYYEYDYKQIVGYSGEEVDLKFVEKSRLNEGKILLYRAHKDVHLQLPAESLSVSLNIVHQSPIQAWHDQYHFDVKNKKIVKILNHVSGEILMRIAVNMIPKEGKDLTMEYLTNHPNDRLRASAWDALLSVCHNDDERHDLIELAAKSDSKMIEERARTLSKTIA